MRLWAPCYHIWKISSASRPSTGCSAVRGCNMTATIGYMMWLQLGGGDWDGGRTGNLSVYSLAPAVPKEHKWPQYRFMLRGAASEGAFCFTYHATQKKLARCVSFIQLKFECYISSKTLRTWKVSSPSKRPQDGHSGLFREEELLAEQQLTCSYHVTVHRSG